VWKFNGEKGVVVKHIPLLDAVRIVFDSEASVLCWCSEISRLETT
jgi:hypothetical protein